MLRKRRNLLVFTFMAFSSLALAQSSSPRQNPTRLTASGSFDVKLTPESSIDKSDTKLARVIIDKQFHGDLEGSSKGEMLSAITDVKGSAGYVAMEKFTGTVKGRRGSFVLQHNATMTRGRPSLSITVVPDSGTGELVGIRGKLSIRIEGGKHYYNFDYVFSESR